MPTGSDDIFVTRRLAAIAPIVAIDIVTRLGRHAAPVHG